jgi:hypothetical protein
MIVVEEYSNHIFYWEVLYMTPFEIESSKVDSSYESASSGSQENAIEFIRNSPVATVTFCQRRFITKIRKLAENEPDLVQIVYENPDGSIVAHIPVSYIHISKSRKGREMTDEEKASAAERLALARQKRLGLLNSDLDDDDDDFDEEEDDE